MAQATIDENDSDKWAKLNRIQKAALLVFYCARRIGRPDVALAEVVKCAGALNGYGEEDLGALRSLVSSNSEAGAKARQAVMAAQPIDAVASMMSRTTVM